MDRVSRVQQPDECGLRREVFIKCSLALSDLSNIAAGRSISYLTNPSGRAWILLAFPDGSEADALRMFEPETDEQRASNQGSCRIALAGPAYEGVAVLALALLGPKHTADSSGASSVRPIFWAEPGVGVDPRKWSIGCFATRYLVFPIFLIHLNAALHSDMQGEVDRLKRKIDRLESQLETKVEDVDRVKEALRSQRRRANQRAKDCLQGHRRVSVAEMSHPETNLCRIDLEFEENEQRNIEREKCPDKKRSRKAGTAGEMGMESLLVKLPGPKKKRLNADGTSPGGLEWDNRVLLNAVLLYTLSHCSLKQAGLAGMSFLSKLSLECFVKPQPRKGCQSRRIDDGKPLSVFKEVSPDSVRIGVLALELAKNEEMITFVRDCNVLNMGHDATSVGIFSLQCVHMRGCIRVHRYTDGAGTRKLGADSRSWCLELKGNGDKFQTQFLVEGEDGKQKHTLITASANLGAQVHQAGLWDAVRRHPALTVVGDGGGEGSGKGDREVARQNMAGENSIGHLMFLRQTTGDDGMKMLNAEGLYVPLYEAYGFDPLNGNISMPLKVPANNVQRMLKEAMIAHRNSGAAESSSSEDEDELAEEERVELSDGDEAPRPVEICLDPRPIYDPLCGSSVQAVAPPMSFNDFVLWDIGNAFPAIGLGTTMRDVTEAMVESVEALANIMREEALGLPVDPAKCQKLSMAGFSSLQKGRHVSDDVITLVLPAITHVHGGRFIYKGGKYTTGPESPLIRSNRPSPSGSSEESTEAFYVIDSINAQRLVNCVDRAETYAASKSESGRGRRKAVNELADMISLLRSRRVHTRQRTDVNEVVFGPGSKLFAFTHLPGHYVSTEVANFGAPDAASTGVVEGGASSRNAVTFTRADSNARNPKFDGIMHTALHITLRALGAIGVTQEVDHFGLPLPPQDKPDCAFYILNRLVSWLTGEFPDPDLWHFQTRMLRCWSDFQAHRQLCHDGAIQDVRSISLIKFHRWQRHHDRIAPHDKTNASAGYALSVPSLQRLPAVYALTELWELAIAARPNADTERRNRERRELKAKLLAEVLKKASIQAELAYKPEARGTYRQLPTTDPVLASASPPFGVRAMGTNDKWTAAYSDLVHGASQRTSMANNPFRHFLMAERDKRGEPGEPGGASEPSGEQDETSGAGQRGASGANGGQRWRRLTNAFILWCIRHRGHLAVEETFKRTDRFPSRAERAVNSARSPFVWPRVREHMRAFLDLPPPKGRDCVRPGPIHEAVKGAMKAQAETWGPPRGKMTIKLRKKTGKPATETEATQRSYYDCMIEEIKEGRLEKPLACAATRWGTRAKSFRWLNLYNRLLAASYIVIHGEGREDALADAAKDVFDVHGWVDGGKTRVPKPVGKQLHMSVNQTDMLMLSIGGFAEQIMVGPMMNAMSHNLESSSTSVCGIDSFFRKLLSFLIEHLFVGKFNMFDSYTGSDTAFELATKTGRALISYSYKGMKGGRLGLLEQRRQGLVDGVQTPAMVRLAHRGTETLRGAHKRKPFLINPSANVQRVMGRFCSDSMKGCVTTLLEGLRRASLMNINKKGKWSEMILYPTLERQWRQEMAPHFKGQMGPEVDAEPVDAERIKEWEKTQSQRFQRNMIKAQWAVAQIIRHDMVEAIVKWFDNELYCILGFLSCSLGTRTVKARRADDHARQIVDVLVANDFALPNLVVALRMLDEMTSHWPADYLADYVPSQLGNLLRSDTAMQQVGQFSLAKDIEGFVLVDMDGRDILDKIGKPMPVGPAPLERFEEAAGLIFDIALHMRSNNDVERTFTHASRGFTRGGRNATPMIISSWVRRKDWISAGFWGKEKDPLFLNKFGKWRKFVIAHQHRMQRLSMPDVAEAEEKKMAAKLKKLAVKYRRGERFAESHIGPSNDFYTFGQKAPGNNDAEDAQVRENLVRRKRTRSDEVLRQRARAKRAHNEPRRTVAKRRRQPQAKAKKARKGKSNLPAPVAAAQAKANSMNSDNDSEANHGGACEGNPVSDGFVASKYPAALSPETGPHAGSEAEKCGHVAQAEAASAAERTGGARPGAASTGSSGLGASADAEGSVQQTWQHPSFDQVQVWLDSPAVKDSRKEMRERTKAAKKAAASKVAGTRASGPRSDAASVEQDEIANESDSDEWDEEWSPSKVSHTCKEYIQVTLQTEGAPIRIYREGTSGVALYHIYDRLTGNSRLAQIQSVWYDKVQRHWRMRYSRVYSTEMAIMACDSEQDKEVKLRDAGQTEKVVIQRGRIHLRDLLKTSDRLYHIGDVRIIGYPVDVVGICAMLPASALILPEARGRQDRKDGLGKTLAVTYGVDKIEARRLAADPIYVGEYFSEMRPEDVVSDEQSSDSDSGGEEQSIGKAETLVTRPSRAPLRKLQERLARDQHPNFLLGLEDDDDNVPLFSAQIMASPTGQKPGDLVAGRASKSGAAAAGDVLSRGSVVTGLSADPATAPVSKGRGRASAAGRGERRDGPGAHEQASDVVGGAGAGDRKPAGRGRGRGMGGRHGESGIGNGLSDGANAVRTAGRGRAAAGATGRGRADDTGSDQEDDSEEDVPLKARIQHHVIR